MTEKLSATKQALITIQRLQARIEADELARTEPIAIVGMGCRFPGGADNPDAYWDLLQRGGDAITEVPADRWSAESYFDADPDAPGKSYTHRGGFLHQIDGFDPQFFGVSPREARQIDPQQRLLLEVAWEALEHANQVPARLLHSPTGVFFGIISMEYASRTIWAPETDRIDAYSGTGGSLSVAAGRLSYLLGLNGPSFVVDTACSSSLLAVHLACQSLRLRECDMALAGGVNLILTPGLHVTFSKARMLSVDGRCKTFDDSADGYGRGEGCGVVVLKRLSDAQAAGDNILACLQGSAVNHNGASGGLTVPNGPVQERLIRSALEQAGLEPAQVDYIEAHGTGTALGDPIEIGALARVFGPGREPSRPLVVGSAKTNFGHLEAAAGIAGLLKVILALQHETIPPHLHFTTPNPHIDWDVCPLEIPTKPQPWPAAKQRLAGVSSFGFSGTNVHVVVAPAPALAEPATPPASAQTEQLLTLSACTPEALQVMARTYTYVVATCPERDLSQLCLGANSCRSVFPYRLAVRGATTDQVSERLSAFIDEQSVAGVVSHRAPQAEPPVAFLFSGQGSQYHGMGRQLYDSEAVFRAALEECGELLSGYLDTPLLEVLFGQNSKLDETAYTQPALFALQYSLAQLWDSWGVQPAIVMGHSVGEYAAACVAGVFDVADGIALVAARGRLMQALPGKGAMLSAEAEEDLVRDVVARHGDKVAIAAINGPRSVVISGTPSSVEAVARELRAQEVETRDLAVSHAFHSPLVEPMLAEFATVAGQVTLHAPKLPVVSNLTGDLVGDEICEPDYWCRHVREPVRFADGMVTCARQGLETFVEIGPRPVLLGMGRACLDDVGVWLPSLRPKRADSEQILDSLATLFVHGIVPDWKQVSGADPHRRFDLPTYPFQRQRYWIEPVVARSQQMESAVHPLLGQRLQSAAFAAGEILFEAFLQPRDLEFLAHHRVFDRVVLPAAGHVELALAAAVQALGSDAVSVEDLVIHRALVLPEDSAQRIQTVLRDRDGQLTLQLFRLEATAQAKWVLHTSATLSAGSPPPPGIDLDAVRATCGESFPVEEYYRQTRARGIEHGDNFQALAGLWKGPQRVLGRLQLPAALRVDDTGFCLHPVLLDGALQMLGLPLLGRGDDPYLPVSIERLHLYRAVPTSMWCILDLLPQEGDAIVAADLRLVDDDGEIIATADSVRFQKVATDALNMATGEDLDDLWYEVTWGVVPQFGGATRFLQGPTTLTGNLASELSDAVSSLAFWPKLVPHLESASVAFVLQAFADLGWTWRVGENVTAEQLAASLDIREVHTALFRRLLQMLAEAGFLAPTDSGWEVVRLPDPMDADAIAIAGIAAAGAGDVEFDLLARCGNNLAAVLQGNVDPLQLLFPDGDMGPLTRFYRDSPGQRAIQVLLQQALTKTLVELPDDQGIRVLEIGAGTGGTTAFLLPHLPEDRTEYVFTDVSPLFTSKAQNHFADTDFLRCEVLDIEQDPADQGFGRHGFDVIVAANVLHATRDLQQTLRHVRSLLAPGGTLLLAEGAARQNWIDLIFGLTEGWWRFVDHDLRPEHALIPPDAWTSLLQRNGFVDSCSLPAKGVRQQLLYPQTLIVAQASATDDNVEPVSWLVLADIGGVADKVARDLRSRGERCLIATAADHRSQESLQQLLRAASASGPIDHVVSCATLDMGTEADATQQLRRSVEACASVLGLLHALNAEFGDQPPTLTIVTAGAAPIEGSMNMPQTPLWGMGKVVAHEQPELRCRRIDLDADAEPAVAASALMAELHSHSDEDQVAFRNGQRLRPRLDRYAPVLEARKLDFDGEASWLITGGTGELGMHIAEWLVEALGVRHLALVGRRAADETVQTRVRQLEALGAVVLVLIADVTDADQMRQMVADVEADLPPVRGILHAAGLLDDGVLATLTAERFADVMAPKVAGAWNLHKLTADWPVDMFVMFSSATALFGAPGQANYAAANAFLDGLAACRRQQNLPALSISWGAWSEIGEAAQRDAGDGLRRRGVGTITPDMGLRLLAPLLSQPVGQLGVIPIDWPVFSREWPLSAFTSHLTQTAASKVGVAVSDVKVQLTSLPAAEQRDKLQHHLQSQVASVLGLSGASAVDADLGFFDLGMDSLTSMELKNQLQDSLGNALPATLLFKYPTIEKLTDFLHGEIFGTESAVDTGDAVEAEAFSEDEIDQLIDAEYEALQGGESAT